MGGHVRGRAKINSCFTAQEFWPPARRERRAYPANGSVRSEQRRPRSKEPVGKCEVICARPLTVLGAWHRRAMVICNHGHGNAIGTERVMKTWLALLGCGTVGTAVTEMQLTKKTSPGSLRPVSGTQTYSGAQGSRSALDHQPRRHLVGTKCRRDACGPDAGCGWRADPAL